MSNSNNSLSPIVMVEMPLPSGLYGYFGMGCFHSYFPKGSVGFKERYITCDGKSVTVYDTTGNWSLELEMKLASEQNLEAALGVMQSLRGQYFAWTGERGVVSIWDIESQSQISYIHVEGSSLGASASISRDGSLVAISVKGRISIHEILSGVKLGEYKDGLGEEKYFEVVLEKEYFMLLDQSPPKDSDNDIVLRKIVRISDMSVVDVLPVHKDYSLECLLNDHFFLYTQGSVANLIKLKSDVISNPETKTLEERDMRDVQINSFSHSDSQEYTSTSGISFSLATSVSVIHGNWMTVLKISRPNEQIDGTESEKSLTIPLGSSHALYSRIYIPELSKLVLISGRYLHVWKLVDDKSCEDVARLEEIWALQIDENKHRIADICIRQVYKALVSNNGEGFALTLLPPQWFRRLKELPRDHSYSDFETVSYPISGLDTLPITQEHRISQGVRGAIDMYIDGDADCRRSVIQYLKKLVRPSPKNPVSCIFTLCQFWNPEDRIYFERMTKELLPLGQITWVPIINERKAGTPYRRQNYDDPLAYLLKLAETQPATIGVAKVIMDYCASHANSSKNLSFLSPIFGSMHEVMTLFPEEAFECLSRIAFIPTKQRSYIIDNHIIAHPPRFRLDFWRPFQQELCDTTDPIMQLNVSPNKPSASNDKFTLPVFMASFDALWFYHDVAPASLDRKAMRKYNEKRMKSSEIELTALEASPTLDRSMESTKPVHVTWWRTLYYLFILKIRLKNKMYVECYNFNIEFFDNPAIAALVAYKWNTIGFSYWLIRFAFQCIFYAMVLIAALLQVYYDGRGNIVGLFIAIIVMSSASECTRNIGHTKTRFNSQHAPPKFLSHVFELRIIESVCKYVTIMQQAITEIRVFFLIFAAGIAAFTVGMLHLLHGCAIGDCEDDPYPKNFLNALSSTYFFMGGIYDPVSDKFGSNDWGFHLMMVVYFFFTVILMLNVLIALINVAFTKGDDGWRLAWIESRLRYIESAENMMYHIPGYRESHNCFPEEIYFTATKQQVNSYKEKYIQKESEREKFKDRVVTKMDARVEELQRQLTSQQERMDKQLQDLKDLLIQNMQK
ncbi:hypothetical protein BGZ76_007053 [Entomortierella beljakovae]|nr:hypothetical protein BGZ76_007053 [Entomortierella beljakovae]